MVYYFDDKRLEENETYDVTIFRGENWFFAWLIKTLRPDQSWFFEQCSGGRGYNVEIDDEQAWDALAELEKYWLEEIIQAYEECGKGCFELSSNQTASGKPERYYFAVDAHFAKHAIDVPEDFMSADCVVVGGVVNHAWKGGKVVMFNPCNPVFDDIKSGAEYNVTVYTL